MKYAQWFLASMYPSKADHDFPSHHFRSLLTLCRLVPLPGGGEVGAALAADEGGRHGRGDRVQVQDPVDAFLQAGQVNELRVCRVRDEMHFRRGRLWRWDLEESKIDELISLLETTIF